MPNPSYKQTVQLALKQLPKHIKLTQLAHDTGIDVDRLRNFKSSGYLNTDDVRKIETWLQIHSPDLIASSDALTPSLHFREKSADATMPTREEIERALLDARALDEPQIKGKIMRLLDQRLAILEEQEAMRKAFTKIQQELHQKFEKRKTDKTFKDWK